MKHRLSIMLIWFCGLAVSAMATELYHTNRTFTPVMFALQGTPPLVDQLYAESGKLTDLVKGMDITINTNETCAIEKQVAIPICYGSAEGAWNAAVAYNGTPSNYPGKTFDNVGWVRGTKSVNGEWGAYLWVLQNRIVFRSSETNWWTSPSNGVRVAISNVLVGSLGDYPPMADTNDIGPYLDAATNNFPGADTSDDKSFGVDIANVFYRLIIPSIWITPRYAVTCVGGSNVQFTVTGTNIPQGVTWSLIPDLSGSEGAIIPSNGAWQAEIVPGNVATNYKIRATSVDNTNFYDGVSLAVLKVDSISTNSDLSATTYPIYVVSNATIKFYAKLDPAGQWPAGKPGWGGAASGSGVSNVDVTFNTVGTNYVTAECGNTVTATVVVIKVELTSDIATNTPKVFECGKTTVESPCGKDPETESVEALVIYYRDVFDYGTKEVQDFDIALKLSPDIAGVQWSKVDGPGSGSLLNATIAEATYRNPTVGGVYQFHVEVSVGPATQTQLWLPVAGPDITHYWTNQIAYFKDTWGPAYRAKLNARTAVFVLRPDFRALLKHSLALNDMKTVGNYLDWSGHVEGEDTPCGGPEEFEGCEYRQTLYGIVIDFSKRNNMLYALIGREMTLTEFELTWAPDLLSYGTPDSNASRESYHAGFDLHDGEGLEDVMNARGYSMQEPGSWTQREWPSPESSEDGLTCVGQSLLENLIE